MSNRENIIVNSGTDTDPEPEPPRRKGLLRRVALLEIIVFFAVALYVDHFILDGTRFSTVEPHPFWIIVILLSVQYGTRMGLLAALASSMVLLFGHLPERLLEQDMHQWFLLAFRLPILWSVTAVVIGELSARHIRARVNLTKELSDSLQRELTLTDSFHTLNTIKERMEIRMAGQWRTVSKTLKTARALEQEDPSHILERSLELMRDLLGPEKFSVYVHQENKLKLTCERGWQNEDKYHREYSADHPVFISIATEQKYLCISKAEDESVIRGEGVLAGPLILPQTGELIGMLKIEKMAFGQFSLNSVRDFEFLCEWVATIYGKALEYQQTASAEKIEKDYFLKLTRRLGIEVARINIQLSDYDNLTSELHSQFAVMLKQSIDDALRSTDLIFDSVETLEENLTSELHAQFAVILKQSIDEALRSTDVIFDSTETLGEFSLLLPGTENQGLNAVRSRLKESLDRRMAASSHRFKYKLCTQPPATADGLRYPPISIASAGM